MVQNHLLQVLSFVAMEPPASLAPEDVRDRKAQLLEAVRPFCVDELVRGQYTAGVVEGREARGYRDEEHVAPDSTVETFVALRAWIDNPRWKDVPFFLRTGKRLPNRATEVVIVLREAQAGLFEGTGIEDLSAHHLALRIQPDEGISLVFRAKEPGPGMILDAVPMEFAYGGSFRTQPTEAYERLLHDAMAEDWRTAVVKGAAFSRACASVIDARGCLRPLINRVRDASTVTRTTIKPTTSKYTANIAYIFPYLSSGAHSSSAEVAESLRGGAPSTTPSMRASRPRARRG
jgi:glucose-6-phosphate 1-dehydrogenase